MIMEKYDELQQYIRMGEPDAKTRAELWQIAIGLQQVDRLKVSDFLVDTAKKHIEGEIDIDDARKLIVSYYKSSDNRTNNEDESEADKASSNIVKILGEQSFTFSVETLLSIHRRIFQNVFKHAGKLRDYDISKKEWVLDGATVLYGPAVDLLRTLQYDFGLEKGYPYAKQNIDDAISHFAGFISGIWQIHPFREGNTRATAVFAIKYLRSLGFEADNDLFKENSWYFRNALVRANYQNVAKGVTSTDKFLVAFFRNLLLGEHNELKNRYMHIRWAESANFPPPPL